MTSAWSDCSTLARSSDEPLAGTAPQARAWLAVEQPGPWGPRVITIPGSSHLPEPVREQLHASTRDQPATAVLVRRPGSHPDDHQPGRTRVVLLANVTPGRRWLVQAHATPEQLLTWDLATAVAEALQGRRPRWGHLVTEPVVLVCTNGRRDRCCALRGRSAARSLDQRWPGQAWESSHLGGHRFAPTVLLLPAGAVYGRSEGDVLTDLVEQAMAGVLPATHLRGLTALSPGQQAADWYVRAQLGAVAADDVQVGPLQPVDEALHHVVVDGSHGSHTLVLTRLVEGHRTESCGAAPVAAAQWRVEPRSAT